MASRNIAARSARNSAPIRVLLVDYRIELWGLEKLIESEKPRMKVVGSATNCIEALRLAGKVSPNVIVLDLDLGKENGLDVIPRLITHSNARVLVLTASRDPAVHDNAVLSGAMGIVEKRLC